MTEHNVDKWILGIAVALLCIGAAAGITGYRSYHNHSESEAVQHCYADLERQQLVAAKCMRSLDVCAANLAAVPPTPEQP